MDDIEDYIGELRSRRFSKLTVEDYFSVLRRLYSYHQKIGKELVDLHRNDLREYFIFLGKANNAISTNHHIVIIRQFYRWMVDRRGLQADPCLHIELKEEKETIPAFLVKYELERLYKLIDEDNAINTQQVTMLDVLVGTGIRTTELCNLKFSDYFEDRGDGFFRLRVTKGGDEREVAMPDYTRDSVLKFMQSIKVRSYTEVWIFPNSKGEQLTRQAAYNRIEKMARKVRSRKKGGHMFRHTFATLAAMRDVPMKAIQMQLGHKDPNTTAGYTHLNIHKLIEVHGKTHPKG
ncbi:MAG: tyrosine-type recombinase/integrase [Cytophagales bacterium]|nr:tyrosine-type recombinase/integrase [Cytophagales bacterium]